jgi:hypothetical protein
MVFVWSNLTKGEPHFTLSQVAFNDLIMVFAFAPIVALLLGLSAIVVPWETLLLSVGLYIIIPVIISQIIRSRVLKTGGQPALDRLLQRLQQFLRESGIDAIDSLVVKGHSDPIGQPHRKELVSGERAKAVAAYLVRELNLPAARVKSQAVSDRELLVANCPAKPVAQRDACNAPNRRVEIVVTGRR